VFSALAATGHGAAALAALTSPAYPGFGYMLANGEGTIWERWEGSARDLVGQSRNHIMMGSPGQFLFQQVAGIDVGRGGVAFDRVVLAPMAAAAAAGSGLSGVDATVGTPRGAVTVAWRAVPTEPDLCGEATEKDDQGQPLHLDCGANSTISAILFASYGTPTGTCADASALAIDPACNAPASVSVATSACVGNQQCTLYANDTQFGGSDPCHGTQKHLAVSAACTNACHPLFTLNATVPVGSNATIVLPYTRPPAVAAGAAPSLILTEAGAPFFRDGALLPGVAVGVTSAQAVDSGFEVVAGGGRYSFALLQCIA